MYRSFRSARGRPASVLVGCGAAALVLAAAAALVALDYRDEVRRSSDQLDVFGQSVVESLHQEFRDLGLLLLSADRLEWIGAENVQTRLDLISALPYVAAVGHAPGDREEITWSIDVLPASISPIGPEMIVQANVGHQSELMYRTISTEVLVAHPYSSDDTRVWDLILVDMVRAAAAAIPSARQVEVIWDFKPLRGSDSLAPPQSEVHREYMILGNSTAWMLELRWTNHALEMLGVGVDWLIIVAGSLLAIIAGWLTSRWVRRRYLEADLRATGDLIEQKDLLLLAISHQMRTPLTGIIGFLRLALDEPEDQMTLEQRRELGRLALGEAELVGEIVEDLLLSTRIEDQQLVMVESVVSVEALLGEIFRATARDSETMRFIDPTSETMVVADPLRVRQLFRNILSGGRDEGVRHWEASVTTDGESVTVALVPDVIVAPRSERLTPDQVAMPHGLSTVQPRLGIARKLCEIMGGDLTVIQRKRQTEIRVTLPAARAPTEEAYLFSGNPAEAAGSRWGLSLRRTG